MEIILEETPEAVASRCADLCVAELQHNPRLVMGLATGSSPLLLYRELINRREQREISFKDVQTFNLDEYVGLPVDHPQSYRRFMDENFFRHIDIVPSNTNVPGGMLADPALCGSIYEKLITNVGGIDLQILGIGRNGHIGFIEPTSSFNSRTRVKTLSDETVRDNSRFFGEGETQPHLSVTMGIKTILEARRVILIATGENKAEAVAAAVEGPMAAICPASSLQLHENAAIIVDQAAASRLKLTKYYVNTTAEQDRLNRERIRSGKSGPLSS